MSTKETLAIRQWCPFSRVVWAKEDDACNWRTSGDPAGSFNRARIAGGREFSVGFCIGSSCAAWRTTGVERLEDEVEMVGLAKKRIKVMHERVGYCGLAGAPGLSDEEAIDAAP